MEVGFLLRRVVLMICVLAVEGKLTEGPLRASIELWGHAECRELRARERRGKGSFTDDSGGIVALITFGVDSPPAANGVGTGQTV